MEWETSDLKKQWETPKKREENFGPTPVARGSSGAKAPALAARPSLWEHGWQLALA